MQGQKKASLERGSTCGRVIEFHTKPAPLLSKHINGIQEQDSALKPGHKY